LRLHLVEGIVTGRAQSVADAIRKARNVITQSPKIISDDLDSSGCVLFPDSHRCLQVKTSP
jgi:hypothetical protein